MAGEPVDLLADIGLRRQQRGLVGQTLLTDADPRLDQVRDLLFEALPQHGRLGFRRFGGGGGQPFDPGEMGPQQGEQAGALFRPRGRQSLEGVGERVQYRPFARRHRRGVLVLLDGLGDAADRHEGIEPRRRRIDPVSQGALKRQNLFQSRFVDPERNLPLAPVDLKRQRQGPAREGARRRLARRGVDRLAARRHAAANVEALAVDAARFPEPGHSVQRPLGAGIAGHAGYGHSGLPAGLRRCAIVPVALPLRCNRCADRRFGDFSRRRRRQQERATRSRTGTDRPARNAGPFRRPRKPRPRRSERCGRRGPRGSAPGRCCR